MRAKKLFAAISVILVLSLFVALYGPAATVSAQENGEESELQEQLDFLGLLIKFVEANYVDEVDVQKLIDGAYKGVFEQLDPYSIYYTKEDYEEFDTRVNGTYGGVGIHISIRDGYVTVITPIEGSPADKAGIKPGDRVVFVDGEDISEYSLDKAASMMRGEPGTTVTLGVLREGQPDVMYFHLTRDIIEINPVNYKVLEDNIGYIRISDFNQHSADNVEKALEYFDSNGVKDIIVDLRNNPGGIIDEVVDVAGFFVPEGPVVHVDRRTRDRETYTSKLKEAKYNLAVLVNEGSASASEIFAGAVQDTGVGTVIGTQTFGKGTVQSVLPLKNGGYIKMTIAKYLTPNEREIDGVGLTPDIVVEDQHPGDEYSGELAPIKGDRKPSLNVVGLDVLGAEQRLDVMGYDVGDIDGIFDQALLQAVAKFQADTGLYPYGVLDFATQQKLQEKFDEFIEQDDVDEQLQKAIEVLKSKR